MTSITSVLLAYTSNNVGNTPQLAGAPAQQTQNAANFGPAYSLDLSDSALSALSGNAPSAQDGVDQLFAMLQQMITDMEDSAGNSGSSSAAATVISANASGNINAFADNALASGGPLPAFLAQVDTRMNLNPTQQQALQSIAAQNMDATDTPDTVQQIALELQQANI